MIPSIAQINEFLSVLGYVQGENVFIRNLYCDPKLKEKFPPKLTKLTYPIKDNQIKQDEGYGVYLYVNGGGTKAKEVPNAKALFCEFDHLSEDEQFRVINKMEGLPQPTFYVRTGGKSIHFYWVFDEAVPIPQWRKLIDDFSIWVGSDTSIKDPSRLMRLPEFYHYSATESGIKRNDKSEFVLVSGEKYSYEKLRDCVEYQIPKEMQNTKESSFSDNKILELVKNVIKPHQEGTNTYDNYRELLGAIKKLYGEDVALNIADIIGSNDSFDWEQIVKSTNGNFNEGTIHYQLIELGFITAQDWKNLFKGNNNKVADNSVQSDSKKDKANNEAWFNIATEDLFSGHWISLNNVLYKFNGQYYEETKDGENKRKINNWCSNYIDENGKKTKATPANVENVFKWVNQKFYVSPDKINCEGIPLKNGYLSLTINKETNKPNFELKPYHHDVYFTYQSEVKYDPKASSESAIKLLECLDDPYKSLFIKSVSTVLGFKEIRKKWDRIKALLLIGDGSNGKDTLREVISLILGEQGITSCSLNDFSQSRGFNIARLATNPKLNWSSENKEINIDSIQSLKQAITGDPLYLEGKGKDGFEVKLNTLFIFNSNHQPDLKGNQFAIQSRLTLIPFTKTYSMTPKRGELKADPRFKHDKDFLVNDVAVGFLNLLINAFGDVYSKGIDYQESEQYFNEVITENNHFRQFADDIGLEFTNDESDRLSMGEIYSHLLNWYYQNGYCDFEETKNNKKKTIWLIDDRKDPPIKASKNLSAKILEIFPKAKIIKGKPVKITGLGIKNAESLDNKATQGTALGMDLGITRVDFGYEQGIDLGISEQKSPDSGEINTQDFPPKQIDPDTQAHTQDLPKNDPKYTQKHTQEKPQNTNKTNTSSDSTYPNLKNEGGQNFGIVNDDDELIYPEKENDLKLLWELAKMGGHNRETLIKYIEEKLNQPIKESRQLTKNQILYIQTNLHYDTLKPD